MPLQHGSPSAQTLPQLPQCCESVCVSVHVPSQHFWLGGQTVHELPQCCGSFSISRHVPLQHPHLGGQHGIPHLTLGLGQTQAPFWQLSLGSHFLPQAPQLKVV